MIQPCRNCPWRSSTRSADIPGGGVDGDRISIAADPEGPPIGYAMGCHLGEPHPPHPCAGFILACPDAASLRLPRAFKVIEIDKYGCDEPILTLAEVVKRHGVRR